MVLAGRQGELGGGGTICLEKQVAEMEVKGVAEGEQACTALQKYFWLKFGSGVNVDTSPHAEKLLMVLDMRLFSLKKRWVNSPWGS